MTLATVLTWSILRSLVLAAVALPPAKLIDRMASSVSRRTSSLILVGALLPLFVPDLLTGFSYRLTAMKMSESWLTVELLYGVLLLFRILALQVAAFLILPISAINQESLHSWKLMPQRDWNWRLHYLRMLLLGPWRSAAMAFAASTIFAFQEFETAALIQVDQHPVTFTVWLFDAHAVGEPLSRSIQFAAGSLSFQTLLLIPLFWLTYSQHRSHGQTADAEWLAGRLFDRRTNTIASVFVGIFVVAGVCLFCLWPLLSNGKLLVGGLSSLTGSSILGSRILQILLSVAVAAVSSVLAMLAAASLRRFPRLMMVSVVPGLTGSLVLSLSLVALFQTSILRDVYDTTLPLVVGLVLLMLPRAVLLDFLLRATSSHDSRGSAQLLRGAKDFRARTGAELIWRLQHRRSLIAAAVLTHWSLWDVTTACLLRPVRFEPIVTRLYNEMHYGRSESLIGITFLTLCIPLMLYATFAGGRRWLRV